MNAHRSRQWGVRLGAVVSVLALTAAALTVTLGGAAHGDARSDHVRSAAADVQASSNSTVRRTGVPGPARQTFGRGGLGLLGGPARLRDSPVRGLVVAGQQRRVPGPGDLGPVPAVPRPSLRTRRDRLLGGTSRRRHDVRAVPVDAVGIRRVLRQSRQGKLEPGRVRQRDVPRHPRSGRRPLR